MSKAKELLELLSATGALFGFLGWLTTRKESVTFSRKHDASKAVELISKFKEINKLPDPEDGWEKELKFPKKEGSNE
jgi:hypothetical protein